jgi:hypothetical protein
LANDAQKDNYHFYGIFARIFQTREAANQALRIAERGNAFENDRIRITGSTGNPLVNPAVKKA